jgi:hypothetical protein
MLRNGDPGINRVVTGKKGHLQSGDVGRTAGKAVVSGACGQGFEIGIDFHISPF